MPDRKKNYVGVNVTPGRSITYERFLAPVDPTETSHGHLYSGVIGPFRTKIGALAMIHYGFGNPHLANVAEAEEVGKRYAEDLKHAPDRRVFTLDL